MTTHNIQLRLQLTGQQAQQQLQRLNLQQSQAQQQQRQSLNQILQTQNRLNASIQQGGRYGQQQMRTGQSMVQTNRLLAQILQQQQRSSSLISQQVQQQQRSYQIQLNTLRQQVAAAERLRQQLQQAGQAQRDNQRNGVGGGGSNLLGGAAAAVGGIVAGGMIVNGAFRPAISYDEQLSRMSVIAAEGKGTAEMRRLKPDLRKVVDSSALSGGSSLQDTAAALDSLLARGKYSYDEAKSILPTISEAAYAGNTSAVGMSVLADSLATYGMRGQKDLQKGFAMALRSGELGGFELKDMQSDLARQLALATSAGYSGEAGLASLLALNQVSMDVSGNAGEAGNNVVNALQKLGSRELSDSMAKAVNNTEGLATVPMYNKKGKYIGEEFNWNKQLQVGRQQGKFGVEVLGDVIDHQLKSNSDYQSLKKQMEKASGDEKKKLLSDMTNIVLGGEIGQIIADRQFLMATMAQTLARQNIDENGVNRIDDLKNKTLNAEYSDVINPTVSFLNEQTFGKEGTAKTSAQIVRQDSFDRVAGGYGTALDKFSEITQQFPAFSQGLFLSTAALTALSASAGIAALTLRRGQPPIPPVPPSTGAAGGLKGALKTAGAAGVAYAGYELFQPLDDKIYKEISQLFGLSGEKNDFVQQAIEKNIEQQSQQNSELLTQQQQANQLSQDISTKLSTLIATTALNKPIPFNASSLMDGISNHASHEEKRHGAALLMYKP